jgi:deoxyribodipyrimidine photo-lyase
MSAIPVTRIQSLNRGTLRPEGRYVLYWMVSARRLEWSFALDRAVEHARQLGRPLLILEALRADYPWASARHHTFVIDGMAEHASRLHDSPVGYHPYVEAAPGEGKGLLEALAGDACVVVTDYFPAFFLPTMVSAAARRVPVLVEAVDGNGLLPLTEAPKAFTAAYHFRRFLQKTLPDHLWHMPGADPLALPGLPPVPELPSGLLQRWPRLSDAALRREPEALARLGVDGSVAPAPVTGGRRAAIDRLGRFLNAGLERYADERNHPDADVESGLSPYLHWGHIGAHEVFSRTVAHEGWSPPRLSDVPDGRRNGWWGMSPGGEAFLDQLVTWRELGFTYCHQRPDYARYDTLPRWALETLDAHAGDERPWVYTMEQFDAAATHDDVWNAAQCQLREEGRIHNYLRMLWGKKILEWTEHPREALDVMVELNNRYALDGRDPNSYSGIFWTLGRFDRGWPERPIYGKVRSMSTPSTRRKVRLKAYLRRWEGDQGSLL